MIVDDFSSSSNSTFFSGDNNSIVDDFDINSVAVSRNYNNYDERWRSSIVDDSLIGKVSIFVNCSGDSIVGYSGDGN